MPDTHCAPRIVSEPHVRVLTLLIGMLFGAHNAGASTLTYNLGYRAEYSDNISRIPNEQAAISDVIHTLTGGFSYIQNTSTFNARVVGSGAHYDYEHGTFDPQTDLALDAYAEMFFVPQVMSWMVGDGFRKVQIDPRVPDVPTNRQNSNVFLTGPNVYLHLGPVDTVTLEARYGRSGIESFNVGSENFNLDSERDFFAARWTHRLSTWSSLALNYEFMDVDYEDSVQNTDFNRHNYFIRSQIRSARNDYTFDVGKSRIELERGAPLSNWLIRLGAARQMSSLSSLNLQYAREYSDTGAQLLPAEATSQPTPGGIQAPLGTDIVSRELFYTELTELAYAWRGHTFPWSARLFSRNVDYQLTASNREEKGLMIDGRYLYSNALSFLAFSSYIVTSYNDPGLPEPIREDRDAIAGVGLLYRLSPGLTAGIDLRRYLRKSSDDSQEYTDDRITATITYGSRTSH